MNTAAFLLLNPPTPEEFSDDDTCRLGETPEDKDKSPAIVDRVIDIGLPLVLLVGAFTILRRIASIGSSSPTTRVVHSTEFVPVLVKQGTDGSVQLAGQVLKAA